MTKAVAGNITESWFCVDCKINTAPGIPDGPTLRREMWMKGRNEICVTDTCEMYTVRANIWRKAGMEPFGGCLCIGCLEKRLGRELKPKDFEPGHPFNSFPGT